MRFCVTICINFYLEGTILAISMHVIMSLLYSDNHSEQPFTRNTQFSAWIMRIPVVHKFPLCSHTTTTDQHGMHTCNFWILITTMDFHARKLNDTSVTCLKLIMMHSFSECQDEPEVIIMDATTLAFRRELDSWKGIFTQSHSLSGTKSGR